MAKITPEAPDGPALAKRKPGRSARIPASPKPKRPNTNDMPVADLAASILGRAFRPRVGEIRRLAEYVQKMEARRLEKLARKEAEKSARKLSKIPKRGKKR